MQKFLKFLKTQTLWIAMIIGAIGYKWFIYMAPIVPYLILLMLFFTFCKVNPLDLRLHLWHWLVLGFQIVVSLILFFLLRPLDAILAQGIMVCVLMPTATAGPIIAGKLGGSIQSLTTFTLLSNVATAILVPLFFPFVNPEIHMSFVQRFWEILSHIGPMLLGPFFAAWILRLGYNAYYKAKHSDKTFHLSTNWAQIPFYVWALTLVVLMAQTTHSLIYDDYNKWAAIGLFGGALLTCIMQFYVGKLIGEYFPAENHGEDYHDVLINKNINANDTKQMSRISAGQALGQKNTTLGVWMSLAYLNPIAALGPAGYIIWQNMFNAWQLSHAAKGKRV